MTAATPQPAADDPSVSDCDACHSFEGYHKAILCLIMSRTRATLTFSVPHEVQKGLEALASPGHEQSHTVLFRQGEAPRGVYLIRRGSVVLSLDSRRHRRAGQGWILGLPSTFSGEPYSLTAIAAEDCDFAFIPRDKIIEFVRLNPALALPLLEVLASEVSAVRRMASGNVTVH